MLRRIWAITQKEFIQVLRDRATLMLLLFMPVVQLTLFATAIHTDIKHIPMVVADQSMSSESRNYLNALVHSDYFDVVASVSGQAEVMKAIDSGQASLGIVIPPDFASRVTLRQANVLILIDGSNSFTTNSAYNTANAISQSYAVSPIKQPVTPLNMVVRILYNPDLKDLWFLVPGLIAALLQGQTLALTALAVVREREVGTIEALLVTPIRPAELMLGKTIPNLVIAFANTGTILLVTTLIFGVPFQGSLFLFIVLSGLFAVGGLGLGLVISVASQSQMQSQQLTMLLNFSGMFLAGFLFPRYALPTLLRLIGYIFPMTYFLPIARGIFSKGVGLEAIWGEVVSIGVLLIVIVFVASRLFRESLD
jgi:ABC-2 type transport system permease protein